MRKRPRAFRFVGRFLLYYFARPAHARQFFFLVGLIGALVDDELRVVYLREIRRKALVGFFVDAFIWSETEDVILTRQE